ncbi:LacI family DNA-binding transcriptional regulator [Paramicrobacterium fandaimingii]|uniref:LacI family DNA-binding transcriptional regulator n=1 Tax=Paramicrobacterium fandaimingii TaxID=2708079 RepID=UPI00141EFF2C|nr:LacI family DNA-binding transcriptional regulator [Microbacterium fandaimingii]
MASPVGIREVAERAKVSIGTVSNVLNKPDLVSAKTLERVLATMDELGFVRNDLARQLKMGGGTTLGMIVLNVANPFFGDLAHACESAAEAHGHTVIFGSSDQLVGREDRYIELFEEQRVRGMIIAPLDGPTERIERLIRRGMPVVLFDIHAGEGDFCSVAMDGAEGGYLATRHLLESGRRKIAFLGGPLHQVEDRWTGALRAVDEVDGAVLTHIDTVDQTIADGRAIGDQLAAMAPESRPDAVFGANDLLALGLMQSLVIADGLKVPRDIAIVGYDDIDYAASAIVPLTTVRQPKESLAHEAVRLVLDHAAAGTSHVHEHSLLPPELVVRASTV